MTRTTSRSSTAVSSREPTSNSRPNQNGFRRWLVEAVSTTKYADRHDDASIESDAARLGILPDVLVEARIMAKERRLTAGRELPKGQKRAGSDHYQFEVLLPKDIDELWRAEAAVRGIKGSALLRSMIHAYLSSQWEPTTLSVIWEVHGVHHQLPDVHGWKKLHGTRYPYRERALVTKGSQRALVLRSSRVGARDPSQIVRNLMMAAIERRWAQPGTITIIDTASMYDDESRYFVG